MRDLTSKPVTTTLISSGASDATVESAGVSLSWIAVSDVMVLPVSYRMTPWSGT
jgi:hypothetical protein